MKRRLEYDKAENRICLRSIPTENDSDTTIENDKLKFDPKYFLRCHSRKNDPADVQTQVWHCAFEPDSENAGRTTSIVATCAGNSVCFINVHSGKVEKKYYAKDIREMFYAVAWTTLLMPLIDMPAMNVLVAAGARSTLHFIDPKNGVAFLEYSVLKSKGKLIVSSLLFHPKQKNVLFCGMSNAEVLLFDIGSPEPPSYSTNVVHLQTLIADSEIFNLSYCSKDDILLTACNNGVRAWTFTGKILSKHEERTDMLKFVMPKKSHDIRSDELQLVDSIEVIQDSIIATKCALHGVIYLWNLSSTLADGAASHNTFKVQPTCILEWSNTDNYFMSMGTHPGNGLLACGDDKGAVWMYNLKNKLRNGGRGRIQPTAILQWPDVEDEYVDKKRKLQLGVYDIVMDKVTISWDSRNLVAVTSNNMVCIWKKNET